MVLGTPLYMFHCHKDALGFLSRHRDALAKRPAAVFALGPFNDEEKEWQEVRGQMAGERCTKRERHPRRGGHAGGQALKE